MRFVSLDLETTGLDPEKDQILEIGMVIEDTEANPLPPVEELPKFQSVVWHRRIKGDAFALQMNTTLLKEIVALGIVDSRVYVLGRAQDFLLAHLGDPPYTVAGKNVAGFDLRFLPPEFRRLFRHRVIDVGAVALGADLDLWKRDMPPSLGDLTGCPVAHRALDDARDVVRVLRRLTDNYGSSEPTTACAPL